MKLPRALCCLSLALLAGCEDPLSRDNTLSLRQQIIQAHRRELAATADSATANLTPIRSDSYLEKDPKRVEALDKISGPTVFRKLPIDPGESLDGAPSPTVALALQQAIRLAAINNLDVRVARLQPAISEAQLVAAEAVFDAVLFTDASFQKIDRPQTDRLVDPDGAGGSPAIPVGLDTQVSDAANLATGIRKPLVSGGQITASTGFDYLNNKTRGLQTTPDPSFLADATLDISQPLLRNFGAYVNRSEILITRNALQRDVLALHNQLLATIAQTEEAYWDLVRARHELAIQLRLTQMTVETRDTLAARADFDVNPVQRAQSQSFVERRRGDVVRAQRLVRESSDRLKRLINDPAIPVASEILIVPVDEPIEAPVGYNLLDAVTTALQRRPEVRAALINIDDASIRQAVADNQRLPLLNLNAQLRYNGLDDSVGGSYERLSDAEFIEYVIGGQFEMPLGNRAAEANFRRSRIERQQAVTNYQRTVQEAVLGVKQALRAQQTAWVLIGLTRVERRAAAENLRALLEREREGEALTPEFLLDLKLSTQQRLAEAETRELISIIEYNVAIIRAREAMGTLLEHNQIQMNWPDSMTPDSEPDRPRDASETRGGTAPGNGGGAGQSGNTGGGAPGQ